MRLIECYTAFRFGTRGSSQSHLHLLTVDCLRCVSPKFYEIKNHWKYLIQISSWASIQWVKFFQNLISLYRFSENYWLFETISEYNLFRKNPAKNKGLAGPSWAMRGTMPFTVLHFAAFHSCKLQRMHPVPPPLRGTIAGSQEGLTLHYVGDWMEYVLCTGQWTKKKGFARTLLFWLVLG